jgi:transposase InsO family protein
LSSATAPAPRCPQSGGSSPPEALSPPAAQAPQEQLRPVPSRAPNERWQLDITHWALADGTDVEILNILDDHSRMCLGSNTLSVFKARDVDNSFGKAVAAYGNPASLLSDNGAVFTGRYRGTGRVALEVTLHARGISFRHSPPQTCGKVERFHQTLKKWLTHQTPAQTVAQLQAQLDSFRAYYNMVRPHRALGRRTPQQAYLARPKATPTGTPLNEGSYRIRHDRIDSNGKLTLRYNSRLHHLGMGRRPGPTMRALQERNLRQEPLDANKAAKTPLPPTLSPPSTGGPRSPRSPSWVACAKPRIRTTLYRLVPHSRRPRAVLIGDVFSPKSAPETKAPEEGAPARHQLMLSRFVIRARP